MFIIDDYKSIILRNFREITHLDYRLDRFYLKRECVERFSAIYDHLGTRDKKLNLD